MTLEIPTWMAFPTRPGRPHQNSAPTMIAQPIRNSPIPSRRSAGSAFAPSGPTPRAALPITCAVPVQALITARPIISNAERRGGLRDAVLPRRRFEAAGDRRRVWPDVERGVVDFLLPADRDFGSGRRAPEPDRGRAGEDARVAMRARLRESTAVTGHHTPVRGGRGSGRTQQRPPTAPRRPARPAPGRGRVRARPPASRPEP